MPINVFHVMLFTEPAIAKNLKLTSNDVTSLTVTWADPDSGVWSGYSISLKDEKDIPEIKVSGSAAKTATFTGLTSGKSYTVVVTTESWNQTSVGLEKPFYTGKSGSIFYGSIFYMTSVLNTSSVTSSFLNSACPRQLDLHWTNAVVICCPRDNLVRV